MKTQLEERLRLTVVDCMGVVAICIEIDEFLHYK